MTDDRGKALVPQGPTGLVPVSRLAQRTLAERVEREERALVTHRTFVVGPGDYATISEAVAAARDGDTVIVRPGRYEESVVVEGKTITIRGDGDRDAIVVGWDQGPAFELVETNSTLTGLTVVGGRPAPQFNGDQFLSVLQAALEAFGGAPHLDGLRVTRGGGIFFMGAAAGAIEHSQIDGNAGGIAVWEGASPRIEENEVWGNGGPGIEIGGAGANPLVRANRVHHGHAAGIIVDSGASPRIEKNEIWANAYSGIEIRHAGTNPLVRANRVHDGQEVGIIVAGGASPRIEANEIWGNAEAGINIAGVSASPMIIGNTVRNGLDAGIVVSEGASPVIEGNTVRGNSRGAVVVGKDSAPAKRPTPSP
jgi:F-box protein 11